MCRQFLIVLLHVILFAFTSATCLAKQYRISQNGTPFEEQLSRILAEINEVPGNGAITIKIESGYYSITKTIDIIAGRHKINFIGSKNKPTIISGSIEVKGWEILSNGMWRSRIPKEIIGKMLPDQLYVNGDRVVRSRIPNDGAFILNGGAPKDAIYGVVLDKKDALKVGKIEKDDVPILSIFRRWIVSKRYLLNNLSFRDTLYFGGKDVQIDKGCGIVIENTKAGIDMPGEWCVDNHGYIYYLPKNAEEIETTTFRIPVLNKLIQLNTKAGGAVGIIFKNIIFEHTAYSIPTGGTNFNQAASIMSAAIEADNINNLSIENCEIRNTANYGIWLRRNCTKSSIKNNYFHNLGAGAIKIGSLSHSYNDSTDLTRHVVVDNNIIYYYGELVESAVGVILFNAADCKITHNDIYYGNYTGVSLGWVWGYKDSPSKRNEVAYNRISHIGTGLLSDLGGIYTLGPSEGTHIHHNNISYIVGKNNEGWGIYADEGTTGVLIENNLVYKTTSGGFHQHYGSNNVVSNNIFAWGENNQVQLSKVKEDHPLTFSRNIIIMRSGTLMSGDSAMSKKYDINSNCYWMIGADIPKIKGIDVKSWIQQRDTTSVYINSSFIAPLQGDFNFVEDNDIKAIGFKRFDYSNIGAKSKLIRLKAKINE